MSIVSAIPGQTVNATLQLPNAAVAPVKWSARDYLGNIIATGQSAVAGTLVIISFVLPSAAPIPSDGSKYSLYASDGVSAVSEYFSVVSPQDTLDDHAIEVSYFVGSSFTDSLVLSAAPDAISVTAFRLDGTTLFTTQTVLPTAFVQQGQAFIYSIDVGVVDTQTSFTWGTGSVVWSYTPVGAVEPVREIHPYYTITPYSSDFMNAIRKITDKANIGDVNKYMEISTTDLMHALTRGADYVMQSPPVMTGFALDTMPRMLRDYIVKAGAIDLLRAQYLAEGMSQGDFQGLGVQLNVDRSQYLDGLSQQLVSDLQGLPAAKNAWMQQGAPLGSTLAGTKRPLGVLAISTGSYSNMPMVPLPLQWVNGTLFNFLRYGPLR